ncbi:hypothetical protein A2V80_01875 [Candidatus Woesebacteria bacterium RBG_16_39_8b]|uniref:Antitoxin n=1 Tax=Candidatus Woesebacteria bacterium RBG_16_39_8b TaxID=1802482 RepID=A0A1F7XCH8_9BACT|nr:MAG: hypothetical protein A2V80_01875 [Candidatus Woesebacteria bacterium RBG_16_39_8b]
MAKTTITVNPEVLAGHPYVKGTRIPVSLILNLLARGYTFEKTIKEYPELTAKNIKDAIFYAEKRIKREEILTL